MIKLLAVLGLMLAAPDPEPRDPWENWGKEEPVMVILHVPMSIVGGICYLMGTPLPPPGQMIYGCAEVGGPVCQIIMPRDSITVDQYKHILRHEKAHCRGWVHGDPQPEETL